MSEGEDQDSKTEDPSERKIQEALDKGQVAVSKEVNSFLMFFFLSLIVIWIIPSILSLSVKSLRYFIENAGLISLDSTMVQILMKSIINKILIYFSPIFSIVIIVAILSSYIQHGEFIFTLDPLQPKLSRISITEGFKRLFSKRSLVEFLKSFSKILLVGIFIFFIIMSDIKQLSQYQFLSVFGILDHMRYMVNHILICSCIIMAVIALLDFSYQKFEHFNQLKMSKHEKKEEHKQSEGSPEIKQRIRTLRKEQAQKRIRQTVPSATVIITNPDHYAVALRYIALEMQAPVLVAKGLDLVALKIKEIAEENNIPIIENPPLARAIYKDVPIDGVLPVEHYEAVAKIISYIMSLKEKKRRG